MKKLFFAIGASLLLNVSHAQNGKVTSAWSAMQTYLSDHDLLSLENGLPYINDATKDSVTAKSTKAWWYRAQLYLYVAIEKDLKTKYIFYISLLSLYILTLNFGKLHPI